LLFVIDADAAIISPLFSHADTRRRHDFADTPLRRHAASRQRPLSPLSQRWRAAASFSSFRSFPLYFIFAYAASSHAVSLPFVAIFVFRFFMLRDCFLLTPLPFSRHAFDVSRRFAATPLFSAPLFSSSSD